MLCVCKPERARSLLIRATWQYSASHMSSASESTTSFQSASRFYDGFDQKLIALARQKQFRTPVGYSELECWSRINELLSTELREPGYLRTSDLFVLACAALRHTVSGTEVCLDDLVGIVARRLKRIHRFSDVISLLYYLRYIELTGERFQPSLVCYTLDRIGDDPQRLSLDALMEVVDRLFTFIQHESHAGTEDLLEKLRITMDKYADFPLDESGKSRIDNHALRIGEKISIYLMSQLEDKRDKNNTSLESILGLLMSLTRGRHCGSPVILEALIKCGMIGMEGGSNRFKLPPELLNLIAQSIRNDQLRRYRSVKSLFQKHPGMWGEVEEILRRGGVLRSSITDSTHCVSSEGCIVLAGIFPKFMVNQYALENPFTKQTAAVSAAADVSPVYHNGVVYLYYSEQTTAWQLGLDPSTPLMRVAYSETDNKTSVPEDARMWKFYSKVYSRFVPVDREIAPTLRRPVGLTEHGGKSIDIKEGFDPKANGDSSTKSSALLHVGVNCSEPCVQWEAAVDSTASDPLEPFIAKQQRLESELAALKAKLESIEYLLTNSGDSRMDEKFQENGTPADISATDMNPTYSTSNPSMFTSLIDKTTNWVDNQLATETTLVQPRTGASFDSFRESEIRRNAKERTALIAARKFRT